MACLMLNMHNWPLLDSAWLGEHFCLSYYLLFGCHMRELIVCFHHIILDVAIVFIGVRVLA